MSRQPVRRRVDALLSAPRLFAWIAAAIIVGGAGAAGVPDTIVNRRFVSDVVVATDGSAAQTLHVELSGATDAAADRIAEESFTDAAGRETLTVVEAATVKPDGRRIPVDPASLRPEPDPDRPDVPTIASARRIVLRFPDVEAGDTVLFTLRRTNIRPELPGQYMAATLFDRTQAWDDARGSFSFPSGMVPRLETHDVPFERSQQDGRTVLAWHYAAPDALAADPAAVSGFDRLPRFFVSTLPDWDAFAAAYRGLVSPRAAVTPNLSAIADQVAGDAATEAARARRLYEYVTRHVGFVEQRLGSAGLEPPAADAVLDAGFGTAQGIATLLQALLAAKGIASEQVLINLGDAYTLSDPPTLAQLDHVILRVPSLGVFLDASTPLAPFGVLPDTEYGKPIVISGGAAPARGTLPLLAPGAASIALSTEAVLDGDGRITGTTTSAATGPFAVVLRLFADAIAHGDAEAIAAQQLRALGWAGTGGFRFPPPDDAAAGDRYAVTARFDLDPHPGFLSGEGFALPTGLRLLARPGDLLAGPLRRPDLPPTAPTPCWSGTETEHLSLALPPGRRLAGLPPSQDLHDGGFDYSVTWREAGGIVTVDRRFVALVGAALCAGDVREAAARMLDDIRRDYRTAVSLQIQ